MPIFRSQNSKQKQRCLALRWQHVTQFRLDDDEDLYILFRFYQEHMEITNLTHWKLELRQSLKSSRVKIKYSLLQGNTIDKTISISFMGTSDLLVFFAEVHHFEFGKCTAFHAQLMQKWLLHFSITSKNLLSAMTIGFRLRDNQMRGNSLFSKTSFLSGMPCSRQQHKSIAKMKFTGCVFIYG